MDIESHVGGDTLFTKIRARLSYILFRARNHDELYRTIQNIIHDREDKDVNWIKRIEGNNAISYYLNLTARGREIYPYSHLIFLFLDYYIIKSAVVIYAGWILSHFFKISVK